MGLIIDISLILSRVKKHYNIKNDADLARFFDVPPTTLSNWKARKSINWPLLFSKCEDMDFNILIKGTPLEVPVSLKEASSINIASKPDPNEIIRLMNYLEVKDKQNQDLSETIGELKYENKLLRKQIGYNNDKLAAEDPKQ